MQWLASLHLPVYTYGILLLFAFVSGIAWFAANCRKLGQPLPDLVDILLVIAISGITGARLLYIILFPEQFSGLADYFALHEGGLVFYGGLFSAIAGLFIYLRQKGIAWQPVFDCLIPSLAMGQALGRLGCLINGCCYGRRSEILHIYRLSGDPEGFFRHPTQAYEAIFLILMAVIATRMLHRQTATGLRKPGILSGLYLSAYSGWRFLIEFLRDDPRGGFFTTMHLSPSQLLSIILMAMGGSMIVYCSKYSAGSGVNCK